MAVSQALDTAVGAHLVGGLHAPDTETAMRTTAGILGRHLHALPDGETGARSQWIFWQVDKFTAIDGIELVGTKDSTARDNEEYSGFPSIAVDESVDQLPPRSLGYADAAEESYAIFTRLREEGAIPPDVKFQVSVPTAFASVVAWIREEDQERFFPVYERGLAAEVEEIVRIVGADDLMIQWDVAVEIGALSQAFVAAGALAEKSTMIEALGRALDASEGVERGVHLCYGDYRHRHFSVPDDLSLCVEFANAVSDRSDFLHIPADRDTGRNPGYYEPLLDLDAARLAIGVVDYEGDEQRTRELIAAATEGGGGREFAVATECGMARIDEREGRGPSLEQLLELHAAVAKPLR